MHEKLVITAKEERGRGGKVNKLLQRLLPEGWRMCRGCNRRVKNCICWRRNGVVEHFLGTLGEFHLTVAGDTASLRHHHQGDAPHPHHHHHTTTTASRHPHPLTTTTALRSPPPQSLTTTSPLRSPPSHQLITTSTTTPLRLTTTATTPVKFATAKYLPPPPHHITTTTNRFPSPHLVTTTPPHSFTTPGRLLTSPQVLTTTTLTNTLSSHTTATTTTDATLALPSSPTTTLTTAASGRLGESPPQHHHHHNHQHRREGGGIRRSCLGGPTWSNHHNHNHQGTLTTTTTSTTTTTMPVSGAPGIHHHNHHHSTSPNQPAPTLLLSPTTTTTTTTTTPLLLDPPSSSSSTTYHHTGSSSTSSSLGSSSVGSSSVSCGDGPAAVPGYGEGSDGDIYQSESEDGSGCLACVITLEERLIKSNPIWFLPDLQRSGAVHLLQGKDHGNFIVRQSSKPDTRALSVRLPPDKGPYIQHYLIEIHDQGTSYSLEASDNKFENLPALIAYYSQCCDELPVQLKLPRAVQEARTRHDLMSLALLGQEFWGTVMASPTAGSPPTPLEQPRSPLPTPSPPPNDLVFSSFGKAGVTRGTSITSLLSPQAQGGMGGLGGSLASSVGGSTTSLTPVRPAPPLPTGGDRSTLNLNLAPLDEILKEQPTFSSFRSQPATPISQLKPGTPGSRPAPPPRASPPTTQWHTQVSPSGSQKPLSKPTPPSRFSPPNPSETSSPISENGDAMSKPSQAPAPPPRWARSCLTTSPSNITVTTTLTLNVNQVKSLPLQTEEPEVTLHVANLEITPAPTSTNGPQGSLVTAAPISDPNGTPASENQSGVLNGYRDGLHLHIRQHITSPQSTPCTPCDSSTPVGEDGGMARVRMRSGRKDKRRLSNHYHEANIVDNGGPYCRSSLADKISDYEDLWTPSPPRDLPSTPSPSQPKMTTFKPSGEFSKSMGDLSEIAKSTKPVHFTYEAETKGDDGSSVCAPDIINGNSSDVTNGNMKSTSPFYMEPADALKEQPQARINKASNKLSRKVTNRYSDSNIQWKSKQSTSCLGKIDSNEDLPLSFSSENLSPNKNNSAINSSLEDERNKNFENEKNKVNASYLNGQSRGDVRRHSRLGGRGKPIAPPRIARDNPNSNLVGETGQEEDREQCVENRFPTGDGGEADSVIIPGDKTVQDLISEKLPDLTLDAHSLAPSHTTRISEYDNVGVGRKDDSRVPLSCPTHTTPPEERLQPPLPTHYFPSTVSDSGTEFSEPWDSRLRESFMHFEDDSSVDHFSRSLTATPALRHTVLDDSDTGGAAITDTDSFVHVLGDIAGGRSDGDDDASIPPTPTVSLAHTTNLDTQQRSRIMSPQLLALRHRQDAENGGAIRAYALDLGRDSSTSFNRHIAHFLTCTLESPEQDPAVVTRNVRQFMSGMKNYLVTSGEREFEAIVKQQQSTLKATEFLNLDAILEDVLVRLVLRPLWTHLNKLFVDAYTASGAIQLLATNMKYARTQPTARLGIRAELWPPRGSTLTIIRNLLARMQSVYAPREKLESLLATISHIYQAMYEGGAGGVKGEAEDLVPMIMWVLSQAGVVSAEVEADYMCWLLLPSASAGEASYYLEAFHSAIHALKNLTPSPDSSPGNSLDSVRQECALVAEHGTVKIVIPDEQNGSIVTRTLPIRPATTTREVCRMMAHKLKVTNPQDYALYKLVDGLESVLTDNECPHKVKADLTTHGFHCTFAFKRIDAKIAWPILS